MTYQTGNSKRAYLAFFFLLGIPALLMLVFALTFSKTLPDVPPAGTFSPMLFAAPFLHLDSAHLISNLVVYLSLVTLLLLIEDWLSRLVLSFAFIVLMLPVIESFIVGLLIPFPLITIGFSGIITALAGILLVVFAFRTDRVFPRLFIYGIFLLNVALSPILYHNYPHNPASPDPSIHPHYTHLPAHCSHCSQNGNILISCYPLLSACAHQKTKQYSVYHPLSLPGFASCLLPYSPLFLSAC